MRMDKQDRGGLALAKAVEAAYAQGQTDYYLEPMVRVDEHGAPVGKIQDGDSVVFCCRRGEREIELTEAFTEADFDRFPRAFMPDLQFVIMTMYHEKFKHLPIAFAPEKVVKPMAQIISEAGLKQFHCAESEKYAHVTFFFNGGENQPFPGEDDVRVPSPKGIPFDQKPELSLPEVSEKVMAAADAGYDFILTNFANGDVIGHTANAEAKLTACHVISETVAKVADYAREKGYIVAVTADHGNIETLYTEAGNHQPGSLSAHGPGKAARYSAGRHVRRRSAHRPVPAGPGNAGGNDRPQPDPAGRYSRKKGDAHHPGRLGLRLPGR